MRCAISTLTSGQLDEEEFSTRVSNFRVPYLTRAIRKKATKKMFKCKNIKLKNCSNNGLFNNTIPISSTEKEKWKSKIIVESPRVKTHRISTFTEQKNAGFGSSNQLDRLKDILKSEPKKKGLLTGGVTFNNIPALYVTNKEYSETEKLANDHKGYTPGESNSRRITDYSNVIPVHNYEHKRLNALRGRDFEYLFLCSRFKNTISYTKTFS